MSTTHLFKVYDDRDFPESLSTDLEGSGYGVEMARNG